METARIIIVGGGFAGVTLAEVLIRRVARPHVAQLGRIPGTNRFSDCERNPDNEAIPGVLIVRVESSILYFNVDHVRECVLRLVAPARTGLRLLVWDLSSSPYVDIAGARMLGEVQRELAESGTKLRLVEARAEVRDLLRAEIGANVGEITRRHSIDHAILEAELALPAERTTGSLP